MAPLIVPIKPTSHDQEDEIQDLPERIYAKCATSKFDDEDKLFLPHGNLTKLVTETAVIQELDLEPDEEGELVEFILTRATKVFAIFIYTQVLTKKSVQVMKQFLESGFDDSSPFFPISPHAKDATGARIAAFGAPLWSDRTIHRFYNDQWMFLAPVFRLKTFEYQLQPGQILPFTWKGSTVDGGNFGKVLEVEIHESHQEFNEVTGSSNDVLVRPHMAIKELQADEDDNDLQKVARTVYQAEATALSYINSLAHPNLIRCHAAITRGNKRFFMFPWADGKNLREYMKSISVPPLTPLFIREVIEQLRGLSEALDNLHHYGGNESHTSHDEDVGAIVDDLFESGGIRHGDLKPENILRFLGADETRIGTLKITDMGLAKHHPSATRLRENLTSTRHGTARYEPPEVDTTGATSRLYDVWSMGCIILELLVWLLYGYDKLKDFNESIRGSLPRDPPYHESQGGTPQLHRKVEICMKFLSEDQECKGDTALAALLRIVKTMLLVVQLPPEHRTIRTSQDPASQNGSPVPASTAKFLVTQHDTGPGESSIAQEYRATAKALVKELTDILEKGSGDENYLATGKSRQRLAPFPFTSVATRNGFLAEPPDRRMGAAAPLLPRQLNESGRSRGGLAPSGMQQAKLDYAHPLLDVRKWDYTVDNKFSTLLLDQLGPETHNLLFTGDPGDQQRLCTTCKAMDFFVPQFRIIDNLAQLKTKIEDCSFCKMRWNACKHLYGTAATTVRFERQESILRMNENDPPVFSICRSLGMRVSEGTQIQVGFPNVSDVHSDIHFETLRLWFRDCEENHAHHKCSPPTPERLPTRLIDVGDKGSTSVRLYETKPTDGFPYIALSHPWGDPKQYRHFCTTQANIAAHKVGIQDRDIQATTFRDAIKVTRELGFRYIWIDSLCIIQGPNGDFQTESKHMENVFSSASCVIAASRARYQEDGFLKGRPAREYVTYTRNSGPPFYVCRYIDDFNRDVLKGALNQRGWVLQERALAHRTIYFTGQQTYWECGAGVRCETLTKMSNQLAGFIGDPNFPDVAIRQSRGGKIRLYQDLYMQYSRLSFTRWEDRAIAILALEKRLVRGFRKDGVRGGAFGVFDDGQGLLHRSLLWHLGIDQITMEPISYPPHRDKAPTWSWMAYQGGINYLDVPFDGVDWDLDNIKSPWAEPHSQLRTADQSDSLEIGVVMRSLKPDAIGERDSRLIGDIPDQVGGQGLKCIILACEKGAKTLEEKLHYTLLVEPVESNSGGPSEVCHRTGVAVLPGHCIELPGPGQRMKLQ